MRKLLALIFLAAVAAGASFQKHPNNNEKDFDANWNLQEGKDHDAYLNLQGETPPHKPPSIVRPVRDDVYGIKSQGASEQKQPNLNLQGETPPPKSSIVRSPRNDISSVKNQAETMDSAREANRNMNMDPYSQVESRRNMRLVDENLGSQEQRRQQSLGSNEEKDNIGLYSRKTYEKQPSLNCRGSFEGSNEEKDNIYFRKTYEKQNPISCRGSFEGRNSEAQNRNNLNDIEYSIAQDALHEVNATAQERDQHLMHIIEIDHMDLTPLKQESQSRMDTSSFCDVKEEDVTFILYTMSSKDPQVLQLNDRSALKQSGFDVSKKTEIFIHGWLEDGSALSEDITKAYFQQARKDVNVILVDYGKHSRCTYMDAAKKVVPTVGKATAKFLRDLLEYGAEAKNIHLIGFSLGAHISGYAAKHLGQKIGRITGLDPAGPGFNFASPDQRLDVTDADFVDVVHTNMNMYGTMKQLGHVDFYVNGGYFQKGCKSDMCSHQRSVEYYLDSIKDATAFYGISCNSYLKWMLGFCKGNTVQIMGEYTPRSTRGKFYLETLAVTPFSKGNSGY